MNQETEKLTADADPVEPASMDAYKPFPVDVLPEPLRSFIAQGAESIGCDPSFIALPSLTVCGAAIGTTRSIRTKDDWEEIPILWTAIVGDSGTKKTPAFRLALKAFRGIQATAFRECKAKRTEYEIEKAKHDVKLREWKKNPGTDRPKAPCAPVPARCFVNEPTIEALLPILEANMRGVLLGRDELSGWFGSFDKYTKGSGGGGDVSHWLSMFNAEPLIVDRKTGDKRTVDIERAALWLTGGIQPKVLQRSLGTENVENGLASRLLMAWPPKRVSYWNTASINPMVDGAMTQLVHDLRSLRGRDQIESPVALTMTNDAQQEWVTFYNQHAEEQAKHTGAMAACLSKLEGYAARLALIVHCVRVAAGDTTLHDHNRVDEVSLRAAIALVRWFGNEARRIYGMFSESTKDASRRKLVDLIRSKGGAINCRELVQASRSFKTVAEAESMLAGLVGAGVGRWEQPSQGAGRQSSKRFVLKSLDKARHTERY